MFRTLFTFCLLSCFFAYADAPQWELNDPNKGWGDDDLVSEYFHHSELQRQWTWELIGRYPLKGDERVLDFGCGDGKITAQLSHCLPKGEIIGVDVSKQMISFAKRAFPRKYYPSLSFLASDDVNFAHVELDPTQKFDKIYSFFVFHLIPNPQVVLSHLRNWVADEGQLIFVTSMGGNITFFEAAARTFAEFDLELPWKKQSATPSQATMRSIQGIEEIMESSGWKISYLNQVQTPFSFVNRDQFIHWMIGTVSANWNIPKSLSYEFFNRLLTHMTEIEPDIVDEKGVYYFALIRVHLVANPVMKDV